MTVPGSPFQVYYTYDASGNRTHRYLNNWQTQTDYTSDGLNRTASVLNTLQNTYAIYSYAYDQVSNRRYERRNGGTGDGYSYDLSGQVTGFQRDGTVNSDGTVSGGTVTLFAYDESGDRTLEWQGGTTTYTANNLNQYSTITGFAAPTYDNNGNLQTFNNWYYTYDAQNRLTGASNGATVAYFWYDGLNRQCTRTINGNTIFSVWDGWNLAEEYQVGNILDTSYMHGAGSDELVSMTRNGQTYYFFQDGLGSTSQLANSSGNWVESYSYDLHGRPSANSTVGNRFLFTGREWYAELGLYNYRNRFYHPDLGRFLQPDPIGFGGDPTNLYRYCGNNPINGSDPSGLDTYFGYRVIATSVAVSAGTPFMYVYTHEFVFTTNPDGTLANTYGWGETTLNGTWSQHAGDETQASNVIAANALIANGGAVRVGGPEMDPYVDAAYDQMSQEPAHLNGGIVNNCYTEAHNLVNAANDMKDASDGGGNGPSGQPNYYPNATGGHAPGAYGFAWGDAHWAYGKNPYGAWGNAGNYNVSGESQDASNLGLALMSQDVTYSGPGEPIEFEGRRHPFGGDLKLAVRW